jgi:ATP-dependent protease ClpP protease subunit
MADSNDIDDDSNLVTCDKNNVYFFTEITPKTQHKFYSVMGQALQYVQNSKADPYMRHDMSIILHINCPGGYATCSFAIYDYLKGITSASVYGIVEGEASSGGSLMFLGCSHRDMTDNSFVLIHELRGECSGKYREQKDRIVCSDLFMNKLKHIYLKETDIEPDTLDDVLSHDMYWDKDTCKKYGILTEDE